VRVFSRTLLLSVLLTGVCSAQIETSLPGLDISLLGDHLSVELKEADFGVVMSEIAAMAGFELDMSETVSQRKLSTKFSDLEIQRGIQRLFTLINHRNYFIYYNAEGSITKVEVFSTGQRKPKMLKAPARPPGSARKHPRARSETGPPKYPSRPPTPPTIEPEEMPSEGSDVPYIPPITEPEYIPPGGKTL
jgi:hypothetical protein